MIQPEYLCDGVTLYEGDCRDVLPGLGRVDAVVTDPPYGVAYSTGRRAACIRSNTRLRNDHLLAPLLGDAGVMYCFAAPERLDTVLPIIKASFDVPNILVWDKGNCSAGDLDTTYGQQWEACIYARRSRVPLIGGRDRDILRFSRGNTSDYEHPTQKPIDLMRYLIRRHDAETILDPFAGSGTTALAAMLEGRKCILIECDHAHCETIRRRVAEANGVGEGSLFRESHKPRQAVLV